MALGAAGGGGDRAGPRARAAPCTALPPACATLAGALAAAPLRARLNEKPDADLGLLLAAVGAGWALGSTGARRWVGLALTGAILTLAPARQHMARTRAYSVSLQALGGREKGCTGAYSQPRPYSQGQGVQG